MTTLAHGWWGTDLGKYRACDGTYAFYGVVPPLDQTLFRGAWQWLQPSKRKDDTPTRAVAALAAAAEAAGSPLPGPFERFMSDPSLQEQVPSCTACTWDLGALVAARKGGAGGFTVRFLRDQQDCLFWYLAVGGVHDGRVLCSPLHFDEVEQTVAPEDVARNTWVVASSFEEFVYRFWLENVLWERINAGKALNEVQQEYVVACRLT